MKDVIAGVDIGGTNTVFGLVDRGGNILSQGKISTPDYPKAKDFVEALSTEISRLVNSTPEVNLTGIGIGAPNANYYTGKVELAPNLPWKGTTPLAEMMKTRNKIPVIITNDANAAAMGEMIFGSAVGMKDFIVLTLGTGVGSGIVVNGKLLYGHTGFAGELGHTVIVEGGRPCGCGKFGCLETYASASGLVKNALQMMGTMREDSTLRNITPSDLTAKIIADAAKDGDPVALEAVQLTAELLGLAITNAIAFSSPEAIFFFGGLAQAGEILFTPVRKYVDDNVLPVFRGTFKILPSGVDEGKAAVLGSAALIWKEMEE